jgi:Fe-S cluster assembly ATP-binding protein
MSDSLLQVKDLSVSIDEGQILHDVNVTINRGETHVLMGPNGAGKSTLGNTLMEIPSTMSLGRILFEGEDITSASVDRRAKAGMYMSFQNPLEVPVCP